MPQRPVSEDYIRDIFNRFGNLIDVRMIKSTNYVMLCSVMNVVLIQRSKQ